jgi:hypothetical protein
MFCITGDFYNLEVYPFTGAITLNGYLAVKEISHSHAYGTYGVANHDHSYGTYTAANHLHADGTYTADNHPHADGTYAAASHNHSVSVGDAISDSGSINATSVGYYVDFWNGSSWVNKYTVASTGLTLGTDVDISNGNTLPDAAGFWRVRILTNSATPDLVQGIIKVKHQLDN